MRTSSQCVCVYEDLCYPSEKDTAHKMTNTPCRTVRRKERCLRIVVAIARSISHVGTMLLLIVRFTTSRRPSQITYLYWLLMLQLCLSTADGLQASLITINPPGPAAGFPEDSSFNLTCISSGRPGNVTWNLPNPIDELDNLANKQIYDLPKRALITSFREGDFFVAVLTVVKVKKTDSGRYTCHPIGIDVSDTVLLQSYPTIHIFISWKEVVGVELNPLKSVHTVTPVQPYFVVPCFNHFSAKYFSPVELALQKKKILTDYNENSWETVDLSSKIYLNWSFADYKGIIIRNPKSGEYRCGAMRFNGTCSIPKWSLYSFFIVEVETVEKDLVDDDKDQQPRIRPTAVPFLVSPSGLTLSLMCKTGAAATHQWNVNWRLPTTFHNDDYDLAKIKSLGRRVVATLSKGNGKNSQSDYSVLNITNASHLDTGYFTCHRADNENISAKQYVFVRDWSVLIATSVNKHFEFDKTDIAIGCRPTHPSVQMSLYRIAADGIPKMVYPSPEKENKDWSYNIFEGLKRNNPVTWETEGTYQCVGRKNYLDGPFRHRSSLYTHELFIGVRGVELKLEVKNSSLPIEDGDFVRLTCRTKRLQDESDALSNLKWNWTCASNNSVTVEFSGDEDSDLVPAGGKLETESENEFHVSHLTWENVTNEAAGTYKCSHKGVSSTPYVLAVSSAAGINSKVNESRLIGGGNTLATSDLVWLVFHAWLLLSIS